MVRFIIKDGTHRANILNNMRSLSDTMANFGYKGGIGTLEKAIMRFEMNCRGKLDFNKDLLPKIAQWAQQFNTTDIPLLNRGVNDQRTFNSVEARYWIANAFFCNINLSNEIDYGEFTFVNLYDSPAIIAQERLLCLLCYFLMATKIDQRHIIFERKIINEDPDVLFNRDEPLNLSRILIHSDRMESKDAHGFVNFANKHFGYGRIINSCTQEEILHSCCPESFLGLMFIETMADNEVIIIRNTRRFSDYTGYGNNFGWSGPYNGKCPIQNQIVMDACFKLHGTKKNIKRDIMKAYAGFNSGNSNEYIISTGHWGCGVFGGDKEHKFLQQILAMNIIALNAIPNIGLNYSTFGEEDTKVRFFEILNNLHNKKVTIKGLYDMVLNFNL